MGAGFSGERRVARPITRALLQETVAALQRPEATLDFYRIGTPEACFLCTRDSGGWLLRFATVCRRWPRPAAEVEIGGRWRLARVRDAAIEGALAEAGVPAGVPAGMRVDGAVWECWMERFIVKD